MLKLDNVELDWSKVQIKRWDIIKRMIMTVEYYTNHLQELIEVGTKWRYI